MKFNEYDIVTLKIQKKILESEFIISQRVALSFQRYIPVRRKYFYSAQEIFFLCAAIKV